MVAGGGRRGFRYVAGATPATGELQVWVDNTEYITMDGTGIGFFGQAPVAQVTYTVTNYTSDRDFDSNANNTLITSDVLSTLIYDLINIGIITGTVA